MHYLQNYAKNVQFLKRCNYWNFKLIQTNMSYKPSFEYLYLQHGSKSIVNDIGRMGAWQGS